MDNYKILLKKKYSEIAHELKLLIPKKEFLITVQMDENYLQYSKGMHTLRGTTQGVHIDVHFKRARKKLIVQCDSFENYSILTLEQKRGVINPNKRAYIVHSLSEEALFEAIGRWVEDNKGGKAGVGSDGCLLPIFLITVGSSLLSIVTLNWI